MCNRSNLRNSIPEKEEVKSVPLLIKKEERSRVLGNTLLRIS